MHTESGEITKEGGILCDHCLSNLDLKPRIVIDVEGDGPISKGLFDTKRHFCGWECFECWVSKRLT